MRFTQVLLLPAVTFSVLSTAAGMDYYVSTSGVDGAARDGSQAEPWRTITHAIGRVSPGDTVHLEAGATFTESVYFPPGSGGALGSPLTLVSDPANRAIVSPSAAADEGCYIYNTGYIAFQNIRFVGQGMDVNQGNGVNAYADDGRYPGLTFVNCEFSGFGGNGLVIGGWGGTDCGFSDVLVDSCTSHDNRTCGISTYAEYASGNSGVTIRDCSTYNNLGDPNAGSHTGSGIVLGGVTDGLIEYCVAYNNGERCLTTGGPIGIWAYQATRVTIQYCEAYSNHAVACDGGGFDLDGGCQDCIIQYCYSHENDGSGYLICQYAGARAFTNNIVRYNISQDDGAGNGFGGIDFYSSGSNGGLQDTLVYGNTIFNSCTKAVRFMGTTGQSGTRMWNNLFVTTGGIPLVEGSPPVSVAKLEGNCYWSSGGGFNVAGYSTLEAWRAATGQEMLGASPVGIQADPLLTNPGAGGIIGDPHQLATLTAYRLLSGSPCIDAGVDMIALFGIDPGPRDFYGNTVPSGAFDIGAHEREAAGGDVSIDSFAADPTTVLPGGSSVLTWATSNAASVTLDGANVSPDGSTTVTPASTTTYTLLAQGTGGPVTRQVTVTVSAEPAVTIDSFAASPPTVAPGGSSTLAWTTSNATSVTLDGANVSPDGSTPVTPASTTTYTLLAQGTGGPVTQQVIVTVTASGGPPLKLDCGTASPVSGWESGNAYVTGGEDYTFPGGPDLSGLVDPAPAEAYVTVRHQDHSYSFASVPNGTYTVRIHFYDYHDASGRAMDYTIEGAKVLDDFNIAAEAGTGRAIIKEFSVTVSDGNGLQIVAEEDAGVDVFEAAIEILDGSEPPAASITVTSPAAGAYKGMQDVTVTWTSAGVAGDVKVEFTGDAWQSATTVAASTANDGALTCELSNLTSTQCGFRVSDVSDGSVSGASAAFSVTAITDNDEDRLDDDWETQHFGDTDVADGTSDTDGDGKSDLQEFWAGTNPVAAGGSVGSGCLGSPRGGGEAWISGLALAAVLLLGCRALRATPFRARRADEDEG